LLAGFLLKWWGISGFEVPAAQAGTDLTLPREILRLLMVLEGDLRQWLEVVCGVRDKIITRDIYSYTTKNDFYYSCTTVHLLGYHEIVSYPAAFLQLRQLCPYCLQCPQTLFRPSCLICLFSGLPCCLANLGASQSSYFTRSSSRIGAQLEHRPEYRNHPASLRESVAESSFEIMSKIEKKNHNGKVFFVCICTGGALVTSCIFVVYE
jgi:hypothetical protein